MTITLDATFDGTAIVTDEPLGLPADTRIRVTVESLNHSEEPASFLKSAMSLNLDGPTDWSENFEHYLNAERASSHE
jgi:hypothetical protein